MTIIAAIALCFIPLAVVFLSFALLTKRFKVWQGLLACVLGMIAVVPIAIMQFFLLSKNFFAANSLLAILISALVINGIVEETMKMGLLFLFPVGEMKLKLFYKYCILSGLTLGCFESLIYLISGFQEIGLRMFSSVLIHIVCAVFDGIFVYGVKHWHFRIAPLSYAIILHGIYNYFAGFGEGPFFYISFAVIAFAVIECRITYLKNTTDTVRPISHTDTY